MPTYTTTVKHALRWLTGTNVFSDVDAGFQALAEDLDGLIAAADTGLLAARPPSTPGSPGKLGRWFYSTDTAQLFFDYGTGWVDAQVRPTIVTALPTTNLYDGQIAHFQNAAMATTGNVWSLRYRSGSASTYKWEFLGGRPIVGYETTNGTLAASAGGYADLASGPVGPDIAFPFNGDYDWEISVQAQVASITGSPGIPGPQLKMASLDVFLFFGLLITAMPLEVSNPMSMSGVGRTNMNKGTYRMQYLVTQTGAPGANDVSIGFYNRTVRVLPVRVQA